MDINEFEAGMLDAVLEAFAGADELTRAQILELFGDDEELAATVVDILADVGLVTKAGAETPAGLPEFIIRDSKAIAFLNDGGFSSQVNTTEPVEPAKPQVDIPVVAESETPSITAPLIAEDVNKADDKEEVFTAEETTADENTEEESDEPDTQNTAQPEPAPARQTREVIFEVEFPQAEQLFEHPELPLDEPDEEEPYELESETIATPVVAHAEIEDQPGFIDVPEVIDEEEPAGHMETSIAEPLEEVPPLPQVNDGEQDATKTPALSPLLSDTDELEQEIAHLRKEQMLAEHKLREKEVMIQTLRDHNKQLQGLRLFIWVLLGLIAALVIGMIFRSR